VELDCLSRLARRQGRPLALSAKELAVLEALMTVSPGYMSAEQLLEKAWDENADPFTKTVTVTIGRLRRKLGEPPVIETNVGVGYRLVGSQHDQRPVSNGLRAAG
jgi:DNA-binding response OmpR family regulator